jgi:hypothetical protein
MADQPTTPRSDEQRTLFGILIGCAGLLVFLLCVAVSIIGVLTLLGPAIGTVFSNIGSTRCAYVFEDVDRDGKYSYDTDVDVSGKTGVEITMTDATGQVLYRGKPDNCYYPTSVQNTTITISLSLPPARTTDNPTRQIRIPTYVQDASSVYFPVVPKEP